MTVKIKVQSSSISADTYLYTFHDDRINTVLREVAIRQKQQIKQTANEQTNKQTRAFGARKLPPRRRISRFEIQIRIFQIRIWIIY